MKWYQVVSVAEKVQTLRERIIMLRYAYIVILIAPIVGPYEWLICPMLNRLNNDVTLNCNKIEFGPRSKRSPSQLRDRQCRYNVTLRRFLETIVALEEQ
jgi:hypothetical protein